MQPSTAYRLYVETSGNFAAAQPGSVQTGVAVANNSPGSAIVVVELWNQDGTQRSEITSITVPGNGHVAAFLNQFSGFDSLPQAFSGTIRLSTASPAGIYVVGLRGRYNERGDFIFTTISPVDDGLPSTTAVQFIPHWVFGGGYTTQFVFSSAKGAASGVLQFFSQAGQEIFPALK